jgi:hypothetical protein
VGYSRDFPHHFGYLHYGPYSHEVKADLDRLVDPSRQLVTEEQSVAGVGFQTFVYRPKPELKAAFQTHDSPWAQLAQELNKRTPQELEAISTILFLRRCGVAESSLEERFHQLKPMLIGHFCPARLFTDNLPVANQS